MEFANASLQDIEGAKNASIFYRVKRAMAVNVSPQVQVTRDAHQKDVGNDKREKKVQ